MLVFGSQALLFLMGKLVLSNSYTNGKILGLHGIFFFFFVFANLSQANLDWGYSVVEMFMHTESVSPQALLILPIPSEAFCQPVCLVEW